MIDRKKLYDDFESNLTEAVYEYGIRSEYIELNLRYIETFVPEVEQLRIRLREDYASVPNWESGKIEHAANHAEVKMLVALNSCIEIAQNQYDWNWVCREDAEERFKGCKAVIKQIVHGTDDDIIAAIKDSLGNDEVVFEELYYDLLEDTDKLFMNGKE